VRVPVFITVGTDDTLTPPAMANALFQHAHQPKRLYFVPGADHNGIVMIGGQGLESLMNGFIGNIH